MLQMRPNCEICDTDLEANKLGALICSFECTFCCKCNETTLKGTCPNCRGELTHRPVREGKNLLKHPASTKRILKKGS